MSLEFVDVCALFEELSQSCSGNQPDSDAIVRTWFQAHDCNLPRRGTGGLALLSCLFPERRRDRVYSLQEKRLESIIEKALGLGTTGVYELQRLQNKEGLDFASAVQQIMSATDETLQPGERMTVEEIDETLDRVASTCAFSSSEIRKKVGYVRVDATAELVKIFQRLHSSEAKWMIRLVLKDLRPVEMPEAVTLPCFHFLLPHLLKVRDSLPAALGLLDSYLISQLPACPALHVEELLKQSASAEIKPQVGIMVSQPSYGKARSIQHCCQLVGKNAVSVERKYDGEYCQIHVSKNEDTHHIKVFSKGGRESTQDRVAIHDAVRKCLGIGTLRCTFDRQCILEGEILVYSDRTQQIMPFYKIRKHVSRAGRYLGCAEDSPTSDDEHLMIMFYDLLLLDDILCIHEPHDQRRRRLWSTVHPIPGRADIGTRETIDFRLPGAQLCLCEAMASAITRGWEGLVLKVRQDPYLSFQKDVRQIKLKKDYIPGLGDSADLVVVGGRRDAKDEQMLYIGNLSWTTFYLACLENKDQVRRLDVKPRFRVVCTVGRPCLSVEDLRHLNDYGKFHRIPFSRRGVQMDVRVDFPPPHQPTELFKEPLVIEVIGAGFDKPANARFFTLRFPRIQKIHGDRSFRDSLSFVEYQGLAAKSKASTEDEDGRVEEHWLMKLGAGCENQRYKGVTSYEVSQRTERTNSSSDTESVLSITPPKLPSKDLLPHGEYDVENGELGQGASTSGQSPALDRKTSSNRPSSPLTALKKSKCLNGLRTNSQEISKSPECSNTEAQVEDSRPAVSQTRTASIEIANSQTDSTGSSKSVSLKRKILGKPQRDISPPQVKRRKPILQTPANQIGMSFTKTRKCEVATTLSSDTRQKPLLNSSRIYEAGQQPTSTPGLQMQRSEAYSQTLHFSAEAQALLSKFEMPILVSESSAKLFLSLYQSILECRDLALSFTLCRRFFVESVQASRNGEVSMKGNRACWHVIVVQLDEHYSFLIEVEALVEMIEQPNAGAADFHILFMDGRLFEMPAKDENLHWQAAIKGYLRFEAGKVVQIIYGARFAADFFRSIR